MILKDFSILLMEFSNHYQADDDSSDSPVPDESGQTFPNGNFVKFDELWDGTLSRKSFSYQFSKINPDHYICTDNEGQIWKTPLDRFSSIFL